MNLVQDAPQTLLIRQRFALFEEVAEAVEGWDLDFCQIGPADGSFFLEQVAGRDALVSRAFFPSRFLQRGCSTPGYRTISILSSLDHTEAWRWCGETVTRNSLLVMPLGGEFESISAPRFDSIHLALSVAKLEQVAQQKFGSPLYHLMPEDRCFCPHGGLPLLTLRRLLEKVAPGCTESGPGLSLSAKLESELAYLVLACLAQNGVDRPRGAQGKRRRALEKALRVIDGQDACLLNTAHLASEIGVARRTLENAFRDGLGVSPAAYLKARRLCALNRDLYRCDDEMMRVADLAITHGFQHQGQMAADYRAMFGELPSATLRRAGH